MYLKMIWNNVRKNFKDYSIYFLTLMIAVALFYAFNSLGSQSAFQTETSNAASNMSKQLVSLLSILSKFIAVILAFLIIYANNFLLKRRKKELGIYMLLGMENRKISSIFVGETILIGVISFITGIAVGCVLSQGISAIALKMFAIDLSKYQFVFSVPSLINTLICFAIIFLVVILFNVRTVSRVKLIDLLNAGRKNESLTIKSMKALLSILLLGILLLSMVAFFVYKKNGLSPDSPIFTISFLLAILGTGCVIYSFFGVLLYILQRNSKWYFKDINTFLIRQISSKIQTNYLTITVVCLLLTATICIVSTGMGMAFTLNSNSNAATPYDVSIIQDLDKEKVGEGETIQEYLLSQGVDLNKYLGEQVEISTYEDKTCTYTQLIEETDDLWDFDKNLPDKTVPIISITDYNKILKSQGKSPLDLEEGTYLLNCKYKGTEKLLQSFLKNSGVIKIADKTLKPAQDKIKEEIYYLTSIGLNDQGTLIVPDSVVINLHKIRVIENGMIKKGSDPQKFDNALVRLIGDPQNPYTFLTKTLICDAYYGMFAMVAFVCCYIGIVFLIICVAILSLQQLTETFDNVYRYNLLQKLGVEKKVCRQTILKQISVYFGAPLVLAGIYAIVGLPKIIDKISISLGLNIGANAGVTIILLLIIYGGYFLVTYFSCRNMIAGKVELKDE
ncbi:ABC transporter permease [Anaerosacchariphilus polymeriproducens]|uniref:ABC transporter permease n=1 Tax=Anaerosacchariphilus polymeriproducens TaxID=1812858 RepID=A0A371AYH2_9FIRM|nr:ABC transporter permease [Anaerosacchariphilus polymeriproducens]RDU24645.1 ABC transporter permease [Anaerosacchariphilus polymeriproducens]